MGDFSWLGRMLIVMGVFLLLLGIAFYKFPGIGRLPGDIFFKKGNFTFYFPIVTSIILSVLLTIVLNLFFRQR